MTAVHLIPPFPNIAMCPSWVAFKELNLSFHDGFTVCIAMNMVSLLL